MALKRDWFQFGSRELLTAAIIVALAIMLFAERRSHKLVRERYVKLTAAPQLSVFAYPVLLREQGPGTPFEIDVDLHHSNEQFFQQEPTISVRLLNPHSLNTVFETMRRDMARSPRGHHFDFKFRSHEVPPLGDYVLVAEAYDGTKLIAKDAIMVRLSSQELQALTEQATKADRVTVPLVERQASEQAP